MQQLVRFALSDLGLRQDVRFVCGLADMLVDCGDVKSRLVDIGVLLHADRKCKIVFEWTFSSGDRFASSGCLKCIDLM